MLYDTPKENTQYTQYNITQNDSRHVFTKKIENGTSYIYHSLLRRLHIGRYSIKVEETPTFFGDYYAFYNQEGVYLGVKNV